MESGIGFVQFDIFCFENESSATRHGIACIDDQIHDDLFDLTWVRFDRKDFSVEAAGKNNIFADKPAHERFDIVGQLIQIEHLRFQHLLPAEGQELLRQHSGPFPAGLDLLEMIAQLLVEPVARQSQFTVAVNDREKIVKVVGNAAGQPPDGLHLL